MSRKHDIINDAEADFFPEEFDDSFDFGVNGLCNGDGCRHSECECWDRFDKIVREQLEKQQNERKAEMQSMFKLYKAEVSYGLYIPKNQAGEEMEED